MKSLPVDALLPQLPATLQASPIVLFEAPPGSGKTTRVAPALIDTELCSSERKCYLLQPRRVAARATALRIANERGWQLGQDVGYHVRFEKRTTATTPLVVATEGILLRRITEDPELADVGTVILDEFHERALNADLLLGMLRRIQESIRDDLRIIVMSATFDAPSLAKKLDATVLKTTGTLFPVDVKYRAPKPRQKMTDHVVETVLLTVEKQPGDLLVFLPGVGEINRISDALKHSNATRGCQILPLHGSLPLEAQSRALTTSDLRRIILATNVAETSLTIEGIRVVIDSGQVRVLRFDPDVGLDRLQLEPICRNSAEQRAGRAGRLENGLCLRLWDEKSQRARPQDLDPEIRRVDLSSAVLQLAAWGESPEEFPWLEQPRPEALAKAVDLLSGLGAMAQGKITNIGRRMAMLPIAPRLARMLTEAEKYGAIETLAFVAAMISERTPFLTPQSASHNRQVTTRRVDRWNCDVVQRFFALNDYFTAGKAHSAFGEIHRGAARAIERVAKQLAKSFAVDQLEIEVTEKTEETIQRCLVAAFPDRLARRRKPNDLKGRMVGGRGVQLLLTSGVMDAEYFLCIDVDAGKTDAKVRLASSVDLSWLPAGSIETREEQFFNPSRKQMEARKRSYYADLLLSESPMGISDEAQCQEILLTEAAKQMDAVLPDAKSDFRSFLTRLHCLRDWAPELELPKCDQALLLGIARDLSPGRRSFAELRSAPWLDWLRSKLTPKQLQAVEKETPDRITVPNGSRKKLIYELGKPPVLEVRIQEIFSWVDTPRVAFGRQPVLLHLLAPNMRPQQVTDDLASFWANTYHVIRKELRRRYPKHSWPEDPLSAKPTR